MSGTINHHLNMSGTTNYHLNESGTYHGAPTQAQQPEPPAAPEPRESAQQSPRSSKPNGTSIRTTGPSSSAASSYPSPRAGGALSAWPGP